MFMFVIRDLYRALMGSTQKLLHLKSLIRTYVLDEASVWLWKLVRSKSGME
jgi:hypothetical protein